MKFENMELTSTPNSTRDDNVFYFVHSNMHNFMSNSETKEVCDEVANRFNNYPKLVELAENLLHIAKVVDEACFNELSDNADVNVMKSELEEIIKLTDGLINNID